MKKAILAAAMVMAMGSTSAMAVEGGQIEFHGLVSATTCSKVVSSSRGNQATDGDVY
ncbi:fimbrial protein, partial [Salmonella enterica subsp. enterica serovar Typhi]|nr:fimbrial protein [Salmonella enterica subsp. enterica serovar Typhi]